MDLKLRFLLWYTNKWAKPKDYDVISAEEVRQENRTELARMGWVVDGRPRSMRRVENLHFQTRDDVQLAIRYYEPPARRGKQAILFFHGGGFVTRDIDSHDKVCRRLAHYLQLPVFSLDYRLAPEHKFPGPVNDCEDAFYWLTQQGDVYGFNSQQIVLSGDSAGANLATVVSQRSRGVDAPKPWRQILIYPTTDARLQHPSIDTLGQGYFLTKRQIQWFVANYSRSEQDIIDPDMSPLLAKDLSDQPPTYLCTAELDPLKDEGIAYAERLREAGVTLIYREFKGVVHGFINMPRIMPAACRRLYADLQHFVHEP